MTLDPGSGLPTGQTVIEDFPDVTSKQCSEHWRREFIDVRGVLRTGLRRPHRPGPRLGAGL